MPAAGDQPVSQSGGVSPLVRIAVIFLAIMYGRDLLLGSPAKDKEVTKSQEKAASPHTPPTRHPMSDEDEEFRDLRPEIPKTPKAIIDQKLLGPRNVLVKLCTS